MAKPRLFISHSASNDETTTKLLGAIQQGLNDKFCVLIDKHEIQVGTDWRRTLNTWIGGCHAAVILLTTKALQSKFVAYEVSILTFRERYFPESKCKVIPVFIDPVDAAQAESAELFKAIRLADTHAIRTKQDDEELIARIRRALDDVAYSDTPLDRQAEFLETVLTRVPAAEIRQALDDLKIQDGPWNSDGVHALTLALLSRGLDQAMDVILNIRSYIKADLAAVFEILSTSWIDLQSTHRIAAAAKSEPAKRAVALNAVSALTAGKYILRASNKPEGWDVAPVTAVDLRPGPLRAEIELSLRNVLALSPREDLPKYLDWCEKRKQPVFVAMPGAGVTPELIAPVRDAFKTVTFFFLAGDSNVVEQVLTDANVEMLEPKLEPDFERIFIETYNGDKLGVVETYLRKNGLL